ncbi:MAG: SAM-dependent methyltransferase [Xanthomonadales bacterium]|nr:SAM-dependent methyltransferase [Xanthomonadales bacterium]
MSFAASTQASILPEPSADLKQHSTRLLDLLKQRIRNNGPLSFADYMEAALYQPGLGYYSAGLHKFGAAGDFITAPELGDLFARCLANTFAPVATQLCAAGPTYEFLEIGAGSGALAADLLQQLDPLPGRYLILERSADLREQQRQRIEARCPQLLQRVHWLDAPPENFRGIVYANEVIDALPIERFRIHNNSVQQQYVGLENECLVTHWQSAGAPVKAAVAQLQSELGYAFVGGYESELNLLLKPWLSGLLESMQQGLLLLSDYGYPRPEFYLPERDQGTLMCHYRHRAHTDPFFWPGLQDLTAFVDFTAVAEAGDGVNGWQLTGYTSQADFLFDSGLAEIMQTEVLDNFRRQLQLAGQIKTLTLPAEMGTRFQFMGFDRGIDAENLPGFGGSDWRHRL